MYGQVGETIQWDTPRGVLSGEIVFVHQNLADNNIDYYSIATGPEPMDRHFLDSNAMKYLNVINLENV
jgi:hypothetical protein